MKLQMQITWPYTCTLSVRTFPAVICGFHTTFGFSRASSHAALDTKCPTNLCGRPTICQGYFKTSRMYSLMREQARSWKFLHGNYLQNIIAGSLTYPGKSERIAWRKWLPSCSLINFANWKAGLCGNI